MIWLRSLTRSLLVIAAVLSLSTELGPTGLHAQEAPAAEAPAAPRVVTDSTVQALLDSRLDSPGDKLRAVLVMIDLKHAFAAKPLVEQLAAAGLDAPTLAALVDRFGAAALMKISVQSELAPQGAELARAALEAQQQVVRDPARIANLVDELKTANRSRAVTLTARLREARSAAVPALLAVLADPAQGDAHRNVRLAVLALEDDALPPLWAALSAEPATRVAAIDMLGEIGSRQSIGPLLFSLHFPPQYEQPHDPNLPGAPHVVRTPAEREAAAAALEKITGYVPLREAALQFLLDKAESLYELSFRPDEPDAAPIEVWRVAQGKLVRQQLPPNRAALAWAADLARDAYAIDPSDPRAAQLHAATTVALQGLARTAQGANFRPDKQSPAEADLLTEVLITSLERGHWSTAAEAATRLGQADKGVLYTSLPQPSALVAALQAPDAQVRFAALQSIMQLKPRVPFPGASHAAEALAHFITAWGQPRAIAVHSEPSKAEELRALLVAAGYEADASVDVRDILRVARSSADYEVAVIDITVPFPTANDVLAELRRDPRTAQLLVAIVAPPERLDEAQRLARRYSLAEGFVRPHTPEALEFELAQVRALDPRAVARDRRAAQGQAALAMLSELTAIDESPLALSASLAAAIESLYRPAQSATVAESLARWGTDTAQRALVDAASLPTFPIELRHTAAQALRRSLVEHGIRLTAEEIARQYDRYNASEHLDADTQAVLGSILDAIEARADATQEFDAWAPLDEDAAARQPPAPQVGPAQ